MYGKYTFYILFSYGVGLLMFLGLTWRVKWNLQQAKRICITVLNERQNASHS